MELQTCIRENLNVFNSDYGKINITSVIMCFLIIYSTALSIVLSVKQLIQVIKEEELLKEEEEEEEVIKEVIDRVEVQTQTNEENYKKEEEKKEEKKDDEEELLLANYNAKERALALQAAYEERAKLTFEKWREAFIKLYKAEPVHVETATHQYCTLLSKIQEEYLEKNEKLTRLEAFNALKKARTIELKHYKEFIHLFNS